MSTDATCILIAILGPGVVAAVATLGYLALAIRAGVNATRDPGGYPMGEDRPPPSRGRDARGTEMVAGLLGTVRAGHDGADERGRWG